MDPPPLNQEAVEGLPQFFHFGFVLRPVHVSAGVTKERHFGVALPSPAFARHLDTTDTVFTFNYDTLLERALDEVGSLGNVQSSLRNLKEFARMGLVAPS